MNEQDAPVLRIVVGVDGSEGSAAALRWAGRLALAAGGEVVATHVTLSTNDGYRPPGLPRVALNESDWRELVAGELEGNWCKELVEAGVPHRTRIEDGRAGPLLTAIAGEERADLLVTGRRALTPLSEMIHGSVSHHVLHHAPCPVAVVPSKPDNGRRAAPAPILRGTPVHRIVVGVDGSTGSDRALRWAIGLAARIDAEIVAVHACQTAAYVPRAGGTPYVPDLSSIERATREEFVHSWCAPLTSSRVRHRTVFREGPAAATLLDIAGEIVADLVVTGRRGRGDLAELVIGSVSHDLVHVAGVPVVVVPPLEAGAPE